MLKITIVINESPITVKPKLISDGTFSQNQIDHTVIANRGVKTHPEIDDHINAPSGNTFDFTPQVSAPPHKEGRVFYSDTEDTLNFYNAVADITVNLPEEIIFKIFNDTGVTITNGQLFTVVGSSGGFPTVTLSQASIIGTATPTGMATHDIPNNAIGYGTYIGTVSGLDTSSFSEGDLLFLSATVAGAFTNVEQEILSPIGRVFISDALNGRVGFFGNGVVNITAIGQTRGQNQVQDVTTTPTKCYCFDLSELEINVDITQTQNPGVGSGFDAVMSPGSVGATGFYRFFFNVSIDATGNAKHIFELYINGSPTGIISSVDVTNNQITAGSGSITGVTETKVSPSDTLEIFVYLNSGTSTVTYESVLSGIDRIGNT